MIWLFRPAITGLLLLTLLALAACGRQAEKAAAPPARPAQQEKLTYCYGGLIPSVVAVANAREMFTAEGLEVSIKPFAMGINALDELLAGKCDVATLAETPLVLKSFERSDFSVLATLRSSDNLDRIVARADKGIHKLADLRGRRVGITKGTAPHFFFDLEMAKVGLRQKDVTLVYLESDRLLHGIMDGSLDAIATVNSMAYRAKEKLGAKALVIEDPGLCLNFALLVSMKEYAGAHPERIRRLLTALHNAEQLLLRSPDKGRAAIMAAQKLSATEYDTVWRQYDDQLGLDNALLATLEEHAGWAREIGLVKRRDIPNYLTFIDASHLQKIAPEAIRLKR